PYAGKNVRVVADEPRVEEVVRRAGLARDVEAELVGLRRGPARRDLVQHPVGDARHRRAHDLGPALGLRPLLDHRAVAIDDAIDPVRLDEVAVRGEGAVGARELDHRERARAEAHREVAGPTPHLALRIDALVDAVVARGQVLALEPVAETEIDVAAVAVLRAGDVTRRVVARNLRERV